MGKFTDAIANLEAAKRKIDAIDSTPFGQVEQHLDRLAEDVSVALRLLNDLRNEGASTIEQRRRARRARVVAARGGGA